LSFLYGKINYPPVKRLIFLKFLFFFRYYEVKLLGVDNVAQIGWADLSFEPHSSSGEGVGDDLHSWYVWFFPPPPPCPCLLSLSPSLLLSTRPSLLPPSSPLFLSSDSFPFFPYLLSPPSFLPQKVSLVFVLRSTFPFSLSLIPRSLLSSSPSPLLSSPLPSSFSFPFHRAYDGNRVLRWYKAVSETWGERWTPDSVVGCLADLDTGTLQFSLDGRPMGVCYSNIAFVGGLRPAMTASLPWASEFNFGDKGVESFWYPPPEGYRPIGELISLHQTKTDLASLLAATVGGDEDSPSSLSRSQAIKPLSKVDHIIVGIKSGLGDAYIEEKTTAVANFNYPTVIADRCLIRNPGKFYFEAELVTLQRQPQRPNSVAVGLVDKAFDGRSSSGKGVGDCTHSWAVDDLGRISEAGVWSSSKSGKFFKTGDVLGVAIDKGEETSAFYVYVGGVEVAKVEGIRTSHAAVPALSLVGGCKVSLNFGGKDFEGKIPEGYEPLNSWLQEQK
jgi:hypothetical protein